MVDAAINNTIDLCTSAVLVAELREVLAYPKFAKHLTAIGESVDSCVGRYLALAMLTAAAAIEGAVTAGPDDGHVIAHALSAQAGVIVPGDAHLLDLKRYQHISIVTPTAALAMIGNG